MIMTISSQNEDHPSEELAYNILPQWTPLLGSMLTKIEFRLVTCWSGDGIIAEESFIASYFTVRGNDYKP